MQEWVDTSNTGTCVRKRSTERDTRRDGGLAPMWTSERRLAARSVEIELSPSPEWVRDVQKRRADRKPGGPLGIQAAALVLESVKRTPADFTERPHTENVEVLHTPNG